MLSNGKHRTGERGGGIPLFYNLIYAFAAIKALMEWLPFFGCFFYIDRSRKVPPTFFNRGAFWLAVTIYKFTTGG